MYVNSHQKQILKAAINKIAAVHEFKWLYIHVTHTHSLSLTFDEIFEHQFQHDVMRPSMQLP